MSDVPPVMKGVFAAVLTPLGKNLTADLDRMAAHCRWLLANGCDGLGILGTTGEANSFGVEERMNILEGLVERDVPAGRMMPGTGCCAFTDTARLCAHAAGLGCGGVLVLPPFYFKDVSDVGVFAAYAEAIERVGDRRLRVYLYNFPQLSGVPITRRLIESLLKRYPETVVGMKDSSGDTGQMLEFVRAFPGFAVFPGSERPFPDVMRAGGAGCITAVTNVTAPLAQAAWRAWSEQGRTDQGAEDTLQRVRAAIVDYPLSAALKTIMARHAGDNGWLRVRPPLTPLSDEDREALLRALDETGYELPPL